jgi:hypothetical protein
MIRSLDNRIRAHRAENRTLWAEISALRGPLLREAINAMGGYRTVRTKRAQSNPKLRRPNAGDKYAAAMMLTGRQAKHEIEATFRKQGIRFTRNMLSQLEGARP